MLIKQFEERFGLEIWYSHNLATKGQFSKGQNGHAKYVIEGQDSRQNILVRTCKDMA